MDPSTTAAIAAAQTRLDTHHGSSSGMAQWYNGKGPNNGDWNYGPYYGGKDFGGKGYGKGHGKSHQGKGKAAPPQQLDKLQKQIESLKKKLTESQNAQKSVTEETQQTLRKNLNLLKADAKDGAVCIVCPKCGTEHSNPKKYKCRNGQCRAILQPGTVPDAAIVKPTPPKNPLLSGYYQALLQEAGATECLVKNLKSDSEDMAEDEDEDMLGGDMGVVANPRAKAEEMLTKLREWEADPAVIRQQEKIVEALPKPKQAKATQPILDVAKLHQALSQATEFHSKIVKLHTESVQACEEAIQLAQKNLQMARVNLAEAQSSANKQTEEIKALIQKKQLESKDVIAPAAPVVSAADLPDQALMLTAFQEWLVQQACPDHIKVFLQGIELRPKAAFVADQQEKGKDKQELPEGVPVPGS